MRALFALVLVSTLAAGCTPYIPVRDDFGTSALVPAGQVPRAYAAFNAYDPTVSGLIAQQVCATPYVPIEDRSVGAVPGHLTETIGRCETHVPFFGNEAP